MLNRFDVIIIGAGAAGLAAAGFIKNRSVCVLERNEKSGKKLYITGKGRCNVTNDCLPADFLGSVVTNPKFLYSSVYGFTPADTKELLRAHGVETKTERGNRVFPVSDKASDVIKALYAHAQSSRTRFVFNERVKSVKHDDGKFTVTAQNEQYVCDKLLIASGGKSYPATGSTGDGYAFAKSLGHNIVFTRPSLVDMTTEQNVSSLAGLTLKNVCVKIEADGAKYSQFGEMLFTHSGVSGPTILRLSAYVNRYSPPLKLYIDLKPALDENTLDKRVTEDFASNANKQLKNSLDALLPKAIIDTVLAQSGLQTDKKVNIITVRERAQLVHTLKNLRFDITALGSFENAVVTAGGVDVKEIHPKTMESKLVKNLYFAGEVIDADALTGGYNIQIALSTGYAAAKAINEGER